MKKLITTLGTLLLAATAQAQLLYDGFAYTPSTNLIGNGGWVEDNTGTDATISAGSLNYTGLQASSGNRVALPGFVGDTRGAQVPFTSVGTVTDIYYSFLLRMDNVNSLSTSFTSLTRVESTSINGIGLAIRQNGGSADLFDLGIHKRGNTGSSVTDPSIQGLSENSLYFIVARYVTNSGNSTDDRMDIWLNPSASTFGNNSLTPTATFGSITGSDTAVDWDTFALTPPAQTTGFFDELRIGLDWASVTPVPEPSGAMLMLFGVGAFAIRRRRSAF